MQCPRCGADNSPLADKCARCEYPFDTSGIIESEAGTPAGPEVSPQAAYTQAPPPGVPPGQPQMPTQPPQGPPPSYPGETPRFYPPGYQAPPPSGMSTGVKALIAVAVILGVVALIAIFAFVYFKSAPTITVPTPPGWEKASEDVLEETEEVFSEGEYPATVDYLFSDGTLSNAIVVYHGDTFLMDTPDSESHEDVKAFYEEHEDEYMNEFDVAYSGLGASYDVQNYEVRELACSVSALHVTIKVSGNNAMLTQDILDFFKDGTEFNVTISKMENTSNQEEVDFFIENISFE